MNLKLPLFMRGVRFRLILLVIFCMLPALGLVIINGLDLRRHLAEDAKTQVINLVQVISSEHKDLIFTSKQLLTTLSQVPGIKNGDPRTSAELLGGLLESHQNFTLIALLSPKGEVLFSVPATPDTFSFSNTRDLADAIKSKSFLVGQFRLGQVTGRPVIPLLYPILDASGDISRILLAGLDVGKIGDDLSKEVLGPGHVFTIVDNKGTIIARNPDADQWVGKSEPDVRIVTSVLAQRKGQIQAHGLDGIERIYAFDTIHAGPNGGLFAFVGIPLNRVFGTIDVFLARNIISICVVLLFAVTAAWIIGNALVVRRISELVEGSELIAGGKLSHRLKEKSPGTEIDRLAAAFNTMAVKLEKREKDRNVAENELRELNQKLGLIVNSSPLAIIILDVSGRIMLWNPAAERIFGWAENEVIGKYSPIIPDDKNSEFKTLLNQVLSGSSFSNVEITRQRRDGSTIDVSLSTSALKDENGKAIGILSILQDISERKAIRSALQESETRYRELVEQMPAIIYLAHAEFPYTATYISPQAQQILGVDETDWKNNENFWVNRVHPDDLGRVTAQLESLTEKNDSIVSEYRMIKSDDMQVWFRDEAKLIDSGNGKKLLKE